MKTAIVIASLFLASVASAADGPKRPSVCAEFSFLTVKGKTVAMCTDGKPKVYESYSVVEVSHPAGGKVRYLLGF